MRAICLIAALCAASLPVTVAAQQVSGRVTMTTDRSEVNVGEPFRLQIRAEISGADVDRFAIPDLSAFEIRGRQVSRPVQFRFGVGGQQQIIQSTTVHTYTLIPHTPGRYELAPATVTAGGQTFTSNPVTVVVGGTPQQPFVPQDPTANATAPDRSTPSGGDPSSRVEVDGAQVDPRAFLRTVADVAEPYVGQQVTVSVYLYTRDPLHAAPQVTREPSADGFWVHDLLPPQRTLDAQTQQIQGVYYRVYLLRRFAAFPLREGELTIGAPEVVLQSGSLFDLLGGGGQAELRRVGVPITIRAKPLPNPPPDAVVGRYTIDAQLDRDRVRTGDAVTLTVVVRGTGNIRDVEFELPPVDGLQVLPPTTEDHIEQPRDRVGGSRRIQWLLIPQRPGTFTLPPLSLHTFDPATERYTEVRAPSLSLTAVGNALDPAPEEPDAGAPGAADAQPEAEPPLPEFGPIRTTSSLRRAAPPVSGQPWFWVLLVGMPLLFAGVAVGRRLARRRAAAPKLASPRRRLAEAATHAKAGDARAFYGAVSTAIKRSLEDKLGENVGGLTHDELRRVLHARAMDPDLIRRIVDELEICDFARFSSAGGSSAEMTQTLDRARELLAKIDAFEPREVA